VAVTYNLYMWVRNQMQEYPPDGVQETNTHNVAAYTAQLAERTFNGKIPPYDYAMSQIGHEMGHRWSAFVSAKVGGENIVLGPTHWRAVAGAGGVPVSAARGSIRDGRRRLQDNFDGTYTAIRRRLLWPATGWSYLDWYLMG